MSAKLSSFAKLNVRWTKCVVQSGLPRLATERADPALAPHVTNCLEVLGVSFTKGNTRPTEKQCSRLDKAKDAARRVRAAPFAGAVRHFYAQCTVASKATYGWLLRAPTLKQVVPCERLLRWAGYGQRTASVHLQKLLLGHSQDLLFMAGQAAVTAVTRSMRTLGRLLTDWTSPGGVTARVRKFLKDLGWVISAPWQWRHSSHPLHCDLRQQGGMTTDQIGHVLREAWRHKMWTSFTSTSRKDSQRFRGLPYDAARCKAAREVAHGAHEVAVLTGAFVSPARFSVMKNGGTPNLCHRNCGAIGTFVHVAWDFAPCSHLMFLLPRMTYRST